MNIHNENSKKRTALYVLLVGLIAIALIVLGLFFAHKKSVWPFSEKSTSQEPTSYNQNTNDFVDYSGPTDQEVDASQDAKKRAEEDQNASQSKQEQSATKQVDVGISYAAINEDKLEIRAFTPNIVEGTGTCTATVTKGDKKITATSEAFIDVSSSICEPMYIDSAQLETGTWSVVVAYSSPTSNGVSEAVKVTR